MKSKTLFQSEVEAIKSSNNTNSELAQIYNVSKRTIREILESELNWKMA